jgi:fumarylacetoacetase
VDVTTDLNATHNIAARSWVESANETGCDFPLQNLPLGVFDGGKGPRIGIAIGDRILCLRSAVNAGLLNELPTEITEALRGEKLNALMALGRGAAAELRQAVFALLEQSSPQKDACAACLLPQSHATMLLPATIGDYTDFYVPARQSPAAELQMGADRLPRARLICGGKRRRSEAAQRPDESRGRACSHVWADAAAGLRVGSWRSDWRGQCRWR